MNIGIDTGGTFTDFVWLDEQGGWRIHKEVSTPGNPAQAILSGLAVLQVPDAVAIIHGTTVATNALLERRGARTALITTAGFRDLLAIGRQNRPDLYALVPQKPEPLVPRPWRFELNERVSAQGDILTPLNLAELDPILAQLQAEKIESVAVCLLFSFLRPTHEQQIEQYIREWTETSDALPLSISLSSTILPEYREYERTSSTVINAYVAPKMTHYLANLAAGVRPRSLAIMQSNGGHLTAQVAGEQAARTVLSGPAGGIVGARYVAGQAGFDQIITFDMGGTSTDVALCPGRLPISTSGEIGGMPLCLPMLAIHTVGAGGGSLAYLDAGRALHVGPQSAGALPGPACYGRGGSQATVTDANLLLGRLDAGHFLGGAMGLDGDAAASALDQVAQALGVNRYAAAWDIIRVANATMERAIRRISVERGYDPRHFTLVPFGGAGPLHACELAEQLLIPQVLIPVTPGVLSALGLLAAAPSRDYAQTIMLPVTPANLEQLSTLFTPLATQAQADGQASGYREMQISYQVDMRYVGQAHELTVAAAAGEWDSLLARFHEAHQQRYGYQQPDKPVEMVTLRLMAAAAITPPTLPRLDPATEPAAAASLGQKQVWFNEQFWETTLYDRGQLRPGHTFTGPAILYQYDSTTVIPPGWGAEVDKFGNVLLQHLLSQ